MLLLAPLLMRSWLQGVGGCVTAQVSMVSCLAAVAPAQQLMPWEETNPPLPQHQDQPASLAVVMMLQLLLWLQQLLEIHLCLCLLA